MNIEEEYSYFELIKLDETVLNQLFLKTRSAIFEGRKNNLDTTALEIYHCYIIKAIEEKSI